MTPSEQISQKRLLPVAVVNSVDQGLKLADALSKGGLDVIEITCRTEAAEDAIEAVAREMPHMLVGAGTVVEGEQCRRILGKGARFIVSPGLDEDVAAAAHEAGAPFFPGVATPTEIMRAVRLGIKTLKFFPAENIGGAPALKALAGPFAHLGVTFVPTGGIKLETAPAYWALPQVAAVGGSWFVGKQYLKAGQYDEITEQTRAALTAASA